MLSYNAIEKKINIGKRGFSISIPKNIREMNGWKLYTRFSYTADPEKHKLVLTESGENTVHQLVLHFASMIKIGCNICSLVKWGIGDTISIVFCGNTIILRRSKIAEKRPVEKQARDMIHHVTISGDFQFLPDRVVSKRNGWSIGTRFSCMTQDGKIVLEESADGNRKISGSIGLINIPKSTCQQAKLQKRDPLKINYEGRKITIRRVV